ncbi:hypothetical protein SUGI_0702160 [Cryptomeria japonica]|uniref:U-box domain-containing protein 33 isoform X2 n=1 Tax=Cryptomeria japonica TaxID=3369 RepID=UPI00241487AD|nr:U-box domain-containing protein 33 isoform X2 [Cryptomeria japonica]GLJ34876.1 hypothetical protein SUGI_0702160 [Cryptomeria japonica]
MEISMTTTNQQGAAQFETQEQNEEIIQMETPPFQQKIYIAVGKDLCESMNALKWALENLDCRQEVLVFLLHIQRPLRQIPSAIGKIPVDQVREDIVKGYRKDVEKELNGCLKKYLDICTKAKVKAETLVVEKNGVKTGIVEAVSEFAITRLIMGTSSASGSISRRMKMVAPGKAEYVRSHVMESCDVWIVCKDKLVSHNAQILKSHISRCPENFGRVVGSLPDIRLDLDICNRSNSIFPVTRYSTPSSGEELNGSRIIVATNEVSSESEAADSPEFNVDEGFSRRTFQLAHQGSQDAEALKNYLRDTLEVSQKAKAEGRRETGKCKKAEAAAINANHRFTALEPVSENRVEVKEEENVHFQDSAVHSGPRIEPLTSVLSSSSNNLEFSEYSFDDLKAATCNFSEHFKLGEGASATVYKGEIRQTTVAVKILKKRSLNSQREFHREIDILRDIRHPHLVRAVGACFERGCVIYEYMSNGSLADHLSCKNTAPPLPWHARVRIAAEVFSALQYLHSLKPHPVIHGDLKPENILLDENFVSKISDFGLACPLPHDLPSQLEPKGRFSYRDPEYQTSAEYCTKSDVYSLGIVILRLLTGKRALGLREDVECALQGGKLGLVLDPSAGDWPFLQATQLAYLALQCTDPVRKKRPDLQPTVMKILDRLREVAVPAPNPTKPVEHDQMRSLRILSVPQTPLHSKGRRYKGSPIAEKTYHLWQIT